MFIQQSSVVSDYIWKKLFSLQIEIVVKNRGSNKQSLKNDDESVRDNKWGAVF